MKPIQDLLLSTPVLAPYTCVHACAACWIGWPGGADEKYLWREGGKPAEAQYVDVATTISQFEPVQMLANPGQVIYSPPQLLVPVATAA